MEKEKNLLLMKLKQKIQMRTCIPRTLFSPFNSCLCLFILNVFIVLHTSFELPHPQVLKWRKICFVHLHVDTEI